MTSECCEGAAEGYYGEAQGGALTSTSKGKSSPLREEVTLSRIHHPARMWKTELKALQA